MSRERELLKRVLNELSIINESDGISGWHLNGDIETWDRTEFPVLMEEIEAELAKPDEPVGVFSGTFNGGIGSPLRIDVKCSGALPEVGTKLYTHPPRREPLSDDDFERIAKEVYNEERFTKEDQVWHNYAWLRRFSRAIEKYHGIGG